MSGGVPQVENLLEAEHVDRPSRRAVPHMSVVYLTCSRAVLTWQLLDVLLCRPVCRHQAPADLLGWPSNTAVNSRPRGAQWGYFAFMAIESLGGSQLWERLLYVLTDAPRRARSAPPRAPPPVTHHAEPLRCLSERPPPSTR